MFSHNGLAPAFGDGIGNIDDVDFPTNFLHPVMPCYLTMPSYTKAANCTPGRSLPSTIALFGNVLLGFKTSKFP